MINERKGERGITLIAVMITVILLSILIAVVVRSAIRPNNVYNETGIVKENFNSAVNDTDIYIGNVASTLTSTNGISSIKAGNPSSSLIETKTITFKNYDGTTLQTVIAEVGSVPQYTGAVPQKSSTQNTTYVFSGWTPSLGIVTENTTYTAQFTDQANLYTITFANYDGTVLQTLNLEYGDPVVYSGSTPTRNSSNGEVTYTFTGWNSALSNVTQNATYIAQYSSVGRTYDVTWSINGVERTSTYAYGDIPICPYSTDKDSTNTTNYIFRGWNPSITSVTENVTYIAQYTSSARYYTVAFQNWDASVILRQQYQYNETVTPPISAAKQPDAAHVYSFNGWSPTVNTTVIADATYTATYQEYTRFYTVSYMSEGAALSVPSVQSKEYNVNLTLHNYVPERTHYQFLGWDTSSTATNVVYNPGDTYSNNESVTLYAVWKLLNNNIPTITTLANYQYIKYSLNQTLNVYDEVTTATEPYNWYNYEEAQWANLKTTSDDSSLMAYWVWIPRFAYALPESASATTISVKFIEGNGTTAFDGTTCYYATDSAITTNGTGLYIDATADAKNGTKFIVHPAFTYNGEQLDGIWVAKYKASSNNTSFDNGGGNTNSLNVQVKPGVTSWRGINLQNMFDVCRNIEKSGGALGTDSSFTISDSWDGTDDTNNIDTHLMKNTEWGAVAILSQSVYGANSQIWNNPNINYITGQAGTTADAYSQTSTASYNSQEGVNASTTGNPYGIYDTAGNASEYVMGIYSDGTGLGAGYDATYPTGFVGPLASGTNTSTRQWPNSRYYNSYLNNTDSSNNYSSALIGDATAEMLPSNHFSWNQDYVSFATLKTPVLMRGGIYSYNTRAGIFSFEGFRGSQNGSVGFRPTLIMK